jgi:hypothetical protein
MRNLRLREFGTMRTPIRRRGVVCGTLLALCLVAAGWASERPGEGDAANLPAAVVDEVHRILAYGCQTVGCHQTRGDETPGRYEVDGSGLANSAAGKLLERPMAIVRPVAFQKSSAKPGTGPQRKTAVWIRGDAFLLNGRPTYEGRVWNGKRIEGLLLNARLVQGIFDDLNPQTRSRWAYPDTGQWDPQRNTREFVEAMHAWRKHGLLGFTINLQGGSPQGYSQKQPWHNSAITAEGALRPEYMARLEKILQRADELGMVAILGVFYFGQDERLRDERAVVRALDAAVDWVLDRGYRNVLIEVNNECNVRYDHAILQPDRVHELIERVKRRSARPDGTRLLVSTSYGGGTVPKENVVRAADFLLMHGNGVNRPERIAEMVRQARQVPGYRPMPILFNEDDHFDFDKPKNNFTAAVGEYASWGYFDPGESNYRDGYQCPPVRWEINTPRKQAFFSLVREMAGP